MDVDELLQELLRKGAYDLTAVMLGLPFERQASSVEPV